MPGYDTKGKVTEATGRICNNCGANVGYYSTAGITVSIGDMEFCCAGCAEAWLDKRQDRPND